jgi:hypothetical protein
MDVCAGGKISPGTSSITFTNDHTVACKITSCQLPGWPSGTQTVPKRQGSTAGSLTVPLNPPPTTPGDYPYTPDCCDKETDPKIKVQ